MNKTGKFIVFEGIDGSGKSSQIIVLKNRLELAGHTVYATFEPTESAIGTMIRTILKGQEKADQRTIAALFAADRLHHILNTEDGLLKKLSEGIIVLSDRYYFSSYAYHSVFMDMDRVIELNKMSADLLRPDLNIFIDVDPEQAMQRIHKNRTETELYENLEMQQNVKRNYETAFEKLQDLEKVIRINGNGNFDAVSDAVWQQIQMVL